MSDWLLLAGELVVAFGAIAAFAGKIKRGITDAVVHAVKPELDKIHGRVDDTHERIDEHIVSEERALQHQSAASAKTAQRLEILERDGSQATAQLRGEMAAARADIAATREDVAEIRGRLRSLEMRGVTP